MRTIRDRPRLERGYHRRVDIWWKLETAHEGSIVPLDEMEACIDPSGVPGRSRRANGEHVLLGRYLHLIRCDPRQFDGERQRLLCLVDIRRGTPLVQRCLRIRIGLRARDAFSGDPKEVVRYDISLHSIANTFRKGHRIRVAIMNALDNDSFPNSNTGKDEATVTETVVGRIAIHHSAGQASQIMLPVMPPVK